MLQTSFTSISCYIRMTVIFRRLSVLKQRVSTAHAYPEFWVYLRGCSEYKQAGSEQIMITSSHFFCFSVLQTFLNNCSVSGIFLGAGWSTVEQCIIIAFIETYFLMNDSYYRTELCNIGYIFKKWERREQNKKKEF